MDNGQQHLESRVFRPRTEFPSQMATPLPAPPLPPSALHQGHIPYNSLQCHGSSLPLPPPPRPPQALLPNTFQAERTGESASSQSSFTPSGSFHGNRYPTPDFTQPPPSFGSYDRGTQEMSLGIQQVTNVLGARQDYGSRQSLVTRENYSFPASSLPLEASYNQSLHNVPNEESWKNSDCVPNEESWKNSSRFHHTPKIVSTCEEPVNFEKQEDQMWLRNFEQQILERKEEQIDSFTSKKKPLKLIEVQHMVSQSRALTRMLIQLKEKFILMKNEEGQSLWDLITQIEKVKVELDGITQKFQDPIFLEDVRRLINQRRKKRSKKKRLHKLKVQERKEQKELVKKEEEKIDAWRERIRQEEEDKRREIAVKTEADTILGEVRQKQTDAVKMQQLLENLISLRIARLNKGAAHGFVATPQQDQLFAITLKKIADVVDAQMGEYKLEEQTLRVMMEESTSYRRSNAGKGPKDAASKLESSLKKILFGDIAPVDQKIYDEYTAAERCLETLIQRRNEWDKFICNEDLPLASSIPSSWVIPPSHPTSDWEKLHGQK